MSLLSARNRDRHTGAACFRDASFKSAKKSEAARRQGAKVPKVPNKVPKVHQSPSPPKSKSTNVQSTDVQATEVPVHQSPGHRSGPSGPPIQGLSHVSTKSTCPCLAGPTRQAKHPAGPIQTSSSTPDLSQKPHTSLILFSFAENFLSHLLKDARINRPTCPACTLCDCCKMLGGFDNPSRYALCNNGGKQFKVRFCEFYRRSAALR